MISPFTPSGAIDEPAVGRICELLISNGIGGIFPLGTTGECSSIHPQEKRRLVAATVKHANGRATVYAGISDNCFRESVESAKEFAHLGAQVVVAHMPSYYPLNDAEIERYFLQLADAVPLPLVLYNIPATTHHHIALDVVDRLRKHPNIVAIKDSSGDKERLTKLLHITGGRDGFPVLLGSSSCYSHGLRQGSVGLVPSGAHIVPALYQQMYEAAMRDDWAAVDELQMQTDQAVAQYLKGKSLGQGLAMLKMILEQRGICGRTMLPPLIDAEGHA